MITRAQLNAALRDLEDRLGRDMDIRIAAALTAQREKTEGQLALLEERPELEREDLRFLIEELTAQMQENCRRHTAEICALRQRMEGLEKKLGGKAAESVQPEEEEAISDELAP